MPRAAWLLVSCAILGGCGGGGGGSNGDSAGVVSPTPTPTSTPAPTPVPTPTPTTAATLLTLTQDTQLTGYSGSNGYYRDLTSGNVTYAQDLSAGPSTTAVYNAASRSFTLFQSAYLIPKTNINGPTSLVKENGSSDSSFSIFSQRDAGVEYKLTQLNIGQSNPTLGLLYTNISLSQVTFKDVSSNLLKVGVSPITFGLQYYSATKVLTGSAVYVGILLGHARGEGSNHVYDVSGTVRFDVNYDTGDFTAVYSFIGKDDMTGQTVNLGSRTVRPSAPRVFLDFLLDSTNNFRTQSNFTGPAAEELMGSFDTNVPDPLLPAVNLKLTGVIVAKRQP